MKKKKILLIEDEPSMRLGISLTLDNAGYDVKVAEDGIAGIKIFREEGFDIVITDLKLPGPDGIEVLKSVKGISSDTGVIIITAFAEVKTAVEAMREGAYDYVAKPFEPEELLFVIERFLKYRNMESENIRLKEELGERGGFQHIIGISSAMQKVFEAVETISNTDSSAIIYGESGTGKELVANAIHNLSPRREGPYIKLNCAAIPETLFESELFGHEKGAFTGAIKRRRGKFEFADGGTIFFDEIGDMPASFQAKLLRVLENYSFERVGGNETLTVDVRTIFATTRQLKDEVKAGRFREDLFYRINTLPIELPPLRERKTDIPLLIEHFLKLFQKKLGKNLTITTEAMGNLTAYDYPGNVRELLYALEMAATFCKDRGITPSCLPLEIRKTGEEDKGAAPDDDDLCLADKVKACEKSIIQKTLEDTGGEKKKTAKKLGISRETLWRKLKDHNISGSGSLKEED